MAFPYLIQVVSDGDKPRLLEVVVVTGKTEWRRYFASGSQEKSFDKAKEYRDMFSTRQKAMDMLKTGMSPTEIDFKEGASKEDIDNALKKLKEDNQKK